MKTVFVMLVTVLSMQSSFADDACESAQEAFRLAGQRCNSIYTMDRVGRGQCWIPVYAAFERRTKNLPNCPQPSHRSAAMMAAPDQALTQTASFHDGVDSSVGATQEVDTLEIPNSVDAI